MWVLVVLDVMLELMSPSMDIMISVGLETPILALTLGLSNITGARVVSQFG